MSPFKSLFIVLALWVGTLLPASGQGQLGFTLSLGKSFMPSVSWAKLHGLGAKKKFQLGYGARLTWAMGINQEYITAPAKLTSGKTGPGVLFISELLEANLDTVLMGKTRIASLNASIHLQYNFSEKLALGFNIDAIGLSLGGKQHGVFNPGNGNNTQNIEAKPTGFNALLISDNDLGTLNSELYVQYKATPQLSVKLGMSFVFLEYTTTQKLALDNDRFRSKVPALGLGLVYYPQSTKS